MAASEEGSFMMVAEVAAEIVSQKLEILLYDPVCVGCLLIETRVKDVKATLATIQELFSTGYRRLVTMKWWRRFLQLMFYSEDFIDEFRLREARERKKALHVVARPLTSLVSRYMLWRDLFYLVNAVKDLCRYRHVPDILPDKEKVRGEGKKELASALWHEEKWERLTNFWDRQRLRNYLCREAEKEKIIKWIENSVDLGVQAISILGRKGAGKTFIARRVYGEASRYQSFEWRVWVHVSTCADQRELLLEILKQVENLPTEGKDVHFYEINKMLCQKLTRTKRFLMVLDDVRQSHEQLLRGLVMIIPPCSQGHIITTTRDDDIAKIMNTSAEEPIQLEDLSDEESWRMLARTVVRVPYGRRHLNEEIDRRPMCHGLPLSISLLGGVLLNAGEDEGAALAREVSKMGLSNILQYSYHKLPVHLKPCFIYMALFPVAFPIPTRRLVRLWLAEGLLDSHCYNEEGKLTRLPEDVGETFILELADRNVIDVVSWRADGSPKACQMLNSLYSMINRKVMNMEFLHINATSVSQTTARLLEISKIRWIAAHTNIVKDNRRHSYHDMKLGYVSGGSYHDMKLGYVSSFLSFYKGRGVLTKDIGTFLRKMMSKTDYSLLRVLDLEGVYKPSLQGVLHKLVLLRYLGLRSTMLDSLPRAIADLHNLETLDIKHTNITSLSSSFWKAGKLRHLHLNWFYIDFKNFLEACCNNVALTQLQTLSRLVIGEVKENLTNKKVLTSLTTLKLFLQRSVGDTSGAERKAVAHWISSELTNLQSLTFGVIQEAEPAEVDKPTKKKAKPATSPIGPLPQLSLAGHHGLYVLYLLGRFNKPIRTQFLPVSLRVLTLSGSKLEADMMLDLFVLLKRLRTFRLLANSFRGKRMTFIKDAFPSLMILKIWKLPRLQEVIIEQDAMLHLRELEFRHLERLKVVEGINNCKELENISVISQSNASIDQFKGGIGEKTNLHFEKDTKRPRSTDDDEDGRDQKGEMMTYSYIENNGEWHKPTNDDEDNSDDDDE